MIVFEESDTQCAKDSKKAPKGTSPMYKLDPYIDADSILRGGVEFAKPNCLKIWGILWLC